VDDHQLMHDDGDGHHGSGLGTNALSGIEAAASSLFRDRRRDPRQTKHEEKHHQRRRQPPNPRMCRRHHRAVAERSRFVCQVKQLHALPPLRSSVIRWRIGIRDARVWRRPRREYFASLVNPYPRRARRPTAGAMTATSARRRRRMTRRTGAQEPPPRLDAPVRSSRFPAWSQAAGACRACLVARRRSTKLTAAATTSRALTAWGTMMPATVGGSPRKNSIANRTAP
jgi:hypothetical protein